MINGISGDQSILDSSTDTLRFLRQTFAISTDQSTELVS
jgi:hypothetical protein